MSLKSVCLCTECVTFLCVSSRVLQTLKMRQQDGVIDGAGRNSLRTTLATAFPQLLGTGEVMGNGPEVRSCASRLCS